MTELLLTVLTALWTFLLVAGCVAFVAQILLAVRRDRRVIVTDADRHPSLRATSRNARIGEVVEDHPEHGVTVVVTRTGAVMSFPDRDAATDHINRTYGR